MDVELTIFLPTFNSAEFFNQTLESLAIQTFKKFNVIVLDNGSRDNTLEIAQAFKDRFLDLEIIVNEKNLGWAGNCNRAIELAHTEFFAIFHSDDVYDSKLVEETISYLRQNDKAGAVGTLGDAIDQNNTFLFSYEIDSLESSLKFDFENLFKHLCSKGNDIFICPSFMFRTEVLKETRGFDSGSFGGAADVGLWLNISQLSDLVILNKKLINYRMHPTQASTKVLRKYHSIDPMVKVLRFYCEKVKKTPPEYYEYVAYRIFVTLTKRSLSGHFSFFTSLRSLVLKHLDRVPKKVWSRRSWFLFLTLLLARNKEVSSFISNFLVSSIAKLKRLGFFKKRFLFI